MTERPGKLIGPKKGYVSDEEPEKTHQHQGSDADLDGYIDWGFIQEPQQRPRSRPQDASETQQD